MKKLGKIISFTLALVLTVTAVVGSVQITSGAAVSRSYKLMDLVKDGKAKPIGRYTKDAKKLGAFWSGNGFELNVKSENKRDELLRVACDTNETVFLAVFIDGKLQDRQERITNENNVIFVFVPEGKHTIRVLRDTQMTRTKDSYFYFDTVEFAGDILKCNPKKDLYIEYIGNSYTSGNGALGGYVSKKAWTDPDDHSFAASYSYKLSEKIGADFTALARGGIGLLTTATEEQKEKNMAKIPMQEIYEYTNGYFDLNTGSPTYDFKRKPDLIVLELGSNDSSKDEERWGEDLVNFVNRLHELNGKDVPILWFGITTPEPEENKEKDDDDETKVRFNSKDHYETVCKIIEENKSAGPLYALLLEYEGLGSAALSTQDHGHPSEEEHEKFAESIFNYIKENKLVKIPEAETEGGKDGKIAAKSFFNGKNIALIGGIGGGAIIIIVVAVILIVKSKKKKRA